MLGKKKSVHITIDDGSSLEYTASIVGILKAHKARATFFVLGQHMEKWPSQADMLKDFQA